MHPMSVKAPCVGPRTDPPRGQHTHLHLSHCLSFQGLWEYRANCSEYFPIFISLLWVAGIFFHQALQISLSGCHSRGHAPSAGGSPRPQSSPLSPRSGCGLWAAVPLHPPQVLPGLHGGCAGTVGAAVRQRPAALAAAGAGGGRAPGTLCAALLLRMGGRAGEAPPAARRLVSRAAALQNPRLVLVGGVGVAWNAQGVSISPALHLPLKGGGSWHFPAGKALLFGADVPSTTDSKRCPGSAHGQHSCVL
ncbi:uncharacterized protein LOC104059405 isoform X2 [Cuculus canorus]|uniref:uncharacterized protein LOC104059405 isoform X2 n=1 Tax=Cuculus canorus TaxID=55661 RepID=UPI0023AA535B|nr:uncharacterized protein LOC104059405 isoform X2 [Cuculus canorus]